MTISVNETSDLASVWKATMGELELQMTRATFNTQLKGAQFVQAKDDVLIIGVRNELVIDWLENRLRGTIERTLTAVAGRPLTCEFVVYSDYPQGSRPEILNLADEKPEMSEQPRTNGNGHFPLHQDGYGGNLTADARQALLQRIKAREEPGRGRPLQFPMEAADPPGDAAIIDMVEDDPLFAHVRTSHYAVRFWRPLIGVIPFSLWELLRSYHFFVKHHKGEWPSIKLLMDSLDVSRHILLGRAACKGRDTQVGAIDVLEQAGILQHHTKGNGRHQVHYFTRVRQQLPILTPYQVNQLTELKQEEHRRFLSYYGFNEAKWLEISYQSELLRGTGEEGS
mgnify:CR=1 FL=1